METELNDHMLGSHTGLFRMSRYGWMNRKNRSSQEWTEETGWRPRPGYRKGLMWRDDQWKECPDEDEDT